MSDYQEPKNFCGRYIEYPHFAELRTEMNPRTLFPVLRNQAAKKKKKIVDPDAPKIILPPPEDPHPNVPPGVPVRPSPCATFYATRDPRNMSDDCKSCMFNEFNITRIPNKEQEITPFDCICDLNSNYSPAEFCSYAQCVQQQNALNGSCVRPFYAIYNYDDIRDENYLPPFSYEQMDYCLQQNN
jgi:hypothetical protein